MKKMVKTFIVCIMIMVLLPVGVYAQGNVETERPVSVVFGAVYAGMPVSGMEVRMYQTASMDETGELHVLEPFNDYTYDLDFHGENDSAWQSMAEMMYQEILTEEHSVSVTGVTDENGTVYMEGMEKGLYLVCSDPCEINGYVYSSLPFFISLPDRNNTENSWNYDINVNAKIEQNPVVMDYSVNKVWKDTGYENRRPSSITVSLICDGKTYGEPVTLPYEGHWSYTWYDLDTNHEWTIREEVPDGYRSTVSREGNVYVLTNTYMPETPSTPDKIPNTGQLWWPVPVLLGLGLICVVIGIIRGRSDHA
ncbi:MAG: Cna B-type domain-containing protein [Bulleidia sp.]